MTVLIGMFILGLFIALGTWVLSWSNHVQKELKVNVFFVPSATSAEEVTVRQHIKAIPGIKDVKFVSRETAFKEQSKLYPDLYKGVTSNPLGDAWVITPIKANDTPAIGRRVQAAHYPGVDLVNWGSTTAKRVLTVAEVVWVSFLVAVVLLVIASTLLIANTIRLSIFARRREIEVMKLVGATNWFIRGPFMLEGLLCGLIGAVAAVILLVIGKEVALPALLPHIGGGSDVHALPFALNALALLGAGLLLGAAGSGLTMRRFLQV
jgi:cell division transport system permease protein